MPGLHDRGADEHVVATLPEVDHDPLERAFVHLTVRDGDARVGHELAQAPRDLIDIRDAIVHEEDLAFAQQLAPNRLDDRGFVELAHVGEYRSPIGRRRRDHRQVADPGEGHLQGARNRARAQRQHVDPDRARLDRLLVLHPEALLLVDDQQPELLEGDGVARADGGSR